MHPNADWTCSAPRSRLLGFSWPSPAAACAGAGHARCWTGFFVALLSFCLYLLLVFGPLWSALYSVETAKTRWNETTSPHFNIRYESKWMPNGLVFILEGIHLKLKVNIGILNPSLLQDKLTFFLYKDKKSYAAGEFKPPSWSNGFSIPGRRSLVMYEGDDKESFGYTAAHELTHIVFGAYFKEKEKEPPRWLDEGLAMLMEDKGAPGSKGERWWESARAYLTRDRVKKIEDFAKTEPGADAKPEDVRDWYLQAYLMTRYLYLEHAKLKFKSFCDAIRAGDDLRMALTKVYGITDLKKMDEAWIQYAGLTQGKTQAKESKFDFKSIEFFDFSSSTSRGMRFKDSTGPKSLQTQPSPGAPGAARKRPRRKP